MDGWQTLMQMPPVALQSGVDLVPCKHTAKDQKHDGHENSGNAPMVDPWHHNAAQQTINGKLGLHRFEYF